MGEPTAEMHDYVHRLTGTDPRSLAVPAGGTAQAPFSFSPLKPKAAPNLFDAKALQPMLEAEGWVKSYLASNNAAALPGGDPAKPPEQIMFGGKPTPTAKVVATVLAAGRLADMHTGDDGRAAITESLVRSVIAEVLKPASADDDTAPGGAPEKCDDDALDTSVETTNTHVDTQIQATIKLRAVPDDKRLVVILPDIEVTLHVGKDANSSSIEGQLNLIKIKKDVAGRMRVNGVVLIQSISFKAGVSGEANMGDAALLRIQKSLEVKFKAELEFKITEHVSLSAQAEGGKDGLQVGPALTYHF